MYKNVKKDKINRKLVQVFEKKKLLYKYIMNNLLLPEEVRLKAYKELSKLNYGFKSSINTRCVLTGRGRSVLSMYKVSRIMFKKLASNGLLDGIKKSSW